MVLSRCALSSIVAAVLTAGCGGEPDPTPTPTPPVASSLTLEKRGDGRSDVSTAPAGLVCDVLCDGVDTPFVYQGLEEISVRIAPARDANFVRAFCTGESDDGVAQETVTGVADGDGAVTMRLTTIVDGSDDAADDAADDDAGARVGVAWHCVSEYRQVTTLQVILQGTGTGRVVGSLSASLDADEPKRLDCPGDCVGAYFATETETITATPSPGSVFVGWDFCGTSTDPVRTLPMTEDTNCRATFDLAP